MDINKNWKETRRGNPGSPARQFSRAEVSRRLQELFSTSPRTQEKEIPMAKVHTQVALTPLTIGDLVRLRSGGPVMTINGECHLTSTIRGFDVAWFDDDGQAQFARFPTAALEAAKLPPPFDPFEDFDDMEVGEEDDEEEDDDCDEDEDVPENDDELLLALLGGQRVIRRDPKKPCGCPFACKCFQGPRVERSPTSCGCNEDCFCMTEEDEDEDAPPVTYQVDVFTPQSVYRRDWIGRGFPEDTFRAKNQVQLFKILRDCANPKAGICKAEVWIGTPPTLPPSPEQNLRSVIQGGTAKNPKNTTTEYVGGCEMQRIVDFAKAAFDKHPAPEEGAGEGARFKLTFTAVGIGTGIRIEDLRTKEYVDVADTESW